MATGYLEQDLWCLIGIELRCRMDTTYPIKPLQGTRKMWLEWAVFTPFIPNSCKHYGNCLPTSDYCDHSRRNVTVPLYFPLAHRVVVLNFVFHTGIVMFFSTGLGDMAVSNTIGSNVFDILVGLGVPWGLQTMAIDYGSTVCIIAKSFICSFCLFKENMS